MAGVITICNSALQKLGAKRIISLEDDTVPGRACNACYEIQRDAELRAHNWKFAIKRASIAAESPDPDWGRAKAYPLPDDYIKLYKLYPELNSLNIDYEIEDGRILTNYTAPLQIRYIYKVTDPNKMDALFREALATKMAIQMCEELTQSNTKKAALKEDYILIVREARKANAFEGIAQQFPEDEWITIRS